MSSSPSPAVKKVGVVTVGASTGAAAGTYLAILMVQLLGLGRWLDDTGVQALSGLLAIVGGVVGGYLAPPSNPSPTGNGNVVQGDISASELRSEVN